jgi:hypothetical protein
MHPLTRAEASGFTQTSRHTDVLSFLAALDHPMLHRTSFGESPEGRELPLLVLSKDGSRTPDEARRGERPVVLIVNGIHAGEVEGKEASMMLVRDLCAGKHPGLLDAITLVVVPLFNPDGNDRIDPSNRALDVAKHTGQIGPDGGVGTRTNAAGINLNRDYMRHEAEEMRLLSSRVCHPWAPDLTIDCHSTNGSVHRFALTYDTPHTVDSGRPEPMVFMREQVLPEVTRRVRAASGRETFFYGNFVEDEGGSGAGWMTYTHHPRFGSNYRGLTGRADVLFEAYSYLPFEERVATTYDLLVHTLRVAGERGDDLRAAVEAAARPRDRVAVRYRLEPTGTEARILTRQPRTLEGAPVEIALPHLARFVGTHVVARPFAYAVSEKVARLMALHGLPVRPLDRAVEAAVEVSIVDEIRQTDSRSILEAPGELLVGAHTEATREVLPAGTWIVETDHRMGAIAVYLCEAESDDGLIAAGLATAPSPGERFPALRIVEPLSR